MSDQMAVGEVEEYAHDGVEPTVEQVIAWAQGRKSASEWFDTIIDQCDVIELGVVFKALLESRKGFIFDGSTMTKSEMRDVSCGSLMRGRFEKIVFAAWQDECKSFLDNGGEL